MQYTSNYNFDLPEENDEMETATRTALDDNFTDLDTLLKDIEDDIDDIQDDISDLDAKTGDDIPFESGSADSISDKITILSNSVGDKPSGETDTIWNKIENLYKPLSNSDFNNVVGTISANNSYVIGDSVVIAIKITNATFTGSGNIVPFSLPNYKPISEGSAFVITPESNTTLYRCWVRSSSGEFVTTRTAPTTVSEMVCYAFYRYR